MSPATPRTQTATRRACALAQYRHRYPSGGLARHELSIGRAAYEFDKIEALHCRIALFRYSSMFSHGGFTPLTGTSGFFFQNILRNLIYLSNPACVARFSWKRCCEPARDGVFGLIESKKPKAEGERICVVVFARRHENI